MFALLSIHEASRGVTEGVSAQQVMAELTASLAAGTLSQSRGPAICPAPACSPVLLALGCSCRVKAWRCVPRLNFCLLGMRSVVRQELRIRLATGMAVNGAYQRAQTSRLSAAALNRSTSL
jgi:hypothetical protein